MNVLLLWAAARERGYRNPTWMTYAQASAHGGQVRRGEAAVKVLLVRTSESLRTDPKTGEEETVTRSFPEAVSGVQLRADRRPAAAVLRAPAVAPAVRGRLREGRRVLRRPRVPAGRVGHPRRQLRPARGRDHHAGTLPVRLRGGLLGHPRARGGALGPGTRAGCTAISAARPGGTRATPARSWSPRSAPPSCARTWASHPAVREDHAQYIGPWLEKLDSDPQAIFEAAHHASKAVTWNRRAGATRSASSGPGSRSRSRADLAASLPVPAPIGMAQESAQGRLFDWAAEREPSHGIGL